MILLSNNLTNVGYAHELINGFCHFLAKNTGQIDNPMDEHYVINNDGVIANNRQFTNYSRMEGQPDCDATTEGQTILILGFLSLYESTKDTKYLTQAEKYWQAEINTFYGGQTIPITPKRFTCNWIVNGKSPVVADYPIDFSSPTHSGFMDTEFTFVNGQTVIPSGADTWGEYLDIATFAYDGVLTWRTIVADVQAVVDGVVQWDSDGTKWEVEWIVDSLGRKIDSNGNIINANATDPKGTVQLQDTTVDGTYPLCYAVKLPVANGGYEIARNETQHNRPLHVPVTQKNYGDASDAQQWWCECCHRLYLATQKTKYYNAWQASLFTIHEYTDIDIGDRFFRQSKVAITPFTDGISYDWSYCATQEDVSVTYSRDDDGYIVFTADFVGDHTIEQKAVKFYVDANSTILTTVGGGTNSHNITWTLSLKLSDTKDSQNYQEFNVTLGTTNSSSLVEYTTHLSDLIPTNAQVVTSSDCDFYGNAIGVTTNNYVINGNYSTFVVTMPDGDSSYEIALVPEVRITAVVYAASTDVDLRLEDAEGWRWNIVLPTNTTFSLVNLADCEQYLSGYQPNHDPTDVRPSVYEPTANSWAMILLEDDANVGWTSVFTFNAMPIAIDHPMFIQYYTLTASFDAPTVAKVGDCYCPIHRFDGLAYTPGTIPFSNIYNSDSEQFDAWHGCPYPGYQSIYVYCDYVGVDKDTLISNMLDFLYDSQQAYFAFIGTMGPCMAEYVWNRWDCLSQGPADTWINMQFNDRAWDGYQARAFFMGCNGLFRMIELGQTPPAKLVTFCQNWLNFLISYWNQYHATPTYFPVDTAPYYIEGDFTGHMTGLFLSGACKLAMCGHSVNGTAQFIENCVTELKENYIVTTNPNHAMNGCWSPAPKLDTGSGADCNGIFYGFWAGEILRGLGLYLQYTKSR